MRATLTTAAFAVATEWPLSGHCRPLGKTHIFANRQHKPAFLGLPALQYTTRMPALCIDSTCDARANKSLKQTPVRNTFEHHVQSL